jgi:hypothetical protein
MSKSPSGSPKSVESVFQILGMPSRLSKYELQKLHKQLEIHFELLLSASRDTAHSIEFTVTHDRNPNVDGVRWHLSTSVRMTVKTGSRTRPSPQDLAQTHEDFVQRLLGSLREHVLVRTWGEPYRRAISTFDRVNVDLDVCDGVGSVSFDEIMEDLGGRVPWEIRLVLKTDLEEAVNQLRDRTRFKRWLHALPGVKKLNPYEQNLLESSKISHNPLIKASFSMQTWGVSGAEIRRNVSYIQSCLSRTSVVSMARLGVMKLSDAVGLLPISRPGSPWSASDSAVAFTTPDHEVFPFDPGFKFRTDLCDFVVDPAGSESDGYHRAVNQALAHQPDHLSRMVAISIDRKKRAFVDEDFTTGSSSLISFDLGPGQAVNILETPLGLQRSTHRVSADLACMLELIGGHLLHGVNWWVLGRSLADHALQTFSITKTPKNYYQGVDLKVDAAIELLDRLPPATWWEVSEQLALLGFVEEARSAHRQAVPTLRDLPPLMTSGWPQLLLSQAQLDTLMGAILQAVRDCPSLGLPTALSLLEVDRLTIDLDTSLSIGAIPKDRVVAIQYLLARKLGAEQIFSNQEWESKGVFYDIHEARHMYGSGLRKISYMDFEQVMGQKSVCASVEGDVRQARKNSVAVSITTRNLSVELDDLTRVITTKAILQPWKLRDDELQHLWTLGVNLDPDLYMQSRDHTGFILCSETASSPHVVCQYLLLPENLETRRNA